MTTQERWMLHRGSGERNDGFAVAGGRLWGKCVSKDAVSG